MSDGKLNYTVYMVSLKHSATLCGADLSHSHSLQTQHIRDYCKFYLWTDKSKCQYNTATLSVLPQIVTH